MSARIATTIELLHAIEQSGSAADRHFEQWARKNRYAGSKDRRFIREALFAILRHRRYLASVFNDEQWRSCTLAAIICNLLPGLGADCDVDQCFDGSAYGAAPLSDSERAHLAAGPAFDPVNPYIRYSIPMWAEHALAERFGDRLLDELQALTQRAPLDMRVNLSKTQAADAQALLAKDHIQTEQIGRATLSILPDPVASGAIPISPALHTSQAFLQGWVEVQDRGAQMLTQLSYRRGDQTILDFCSGAGGKALHLADLVGQQGEVFVHDVTTQRLSGLAPRQKRAGYGHIRPAMGDGLAELTGRADLVVVDVPCSGSGRWRRNPETKWQFTEQRLHDVRRDQAEILRAAAAYVRPGGRLAYMTCSLLPPENQSQIQQFLSDRSDFVPAPLNFEAACAAFPATFSALSIDETAYDYALSPAMTGSDGFYVATLMRETNNQ